MRKGIIIRVPDGTELPFDLSSALAVRFPGYTRETYSQKPDYHRSFVRRVTSLCNAFSFLLDAYPCFAKNFPFTQDTLKMYAEDYKSISIEAKGSTYELHNELEKFTARLIQLIALAWNRTDIKEAVVLLNDAEQYVLMCEGRDDLATLIPMKLGGDVDYILQLDESLPPHYPLLLDELKLIKAKNYPKTPDWLRQLKEYQHAYFCNLDPKIDSYLGVVRDFSGFLTTWDSIKKKTFNLNSELEFIVKEALPLPSWFKDLSMHQQEMIRILAAEPTSLDENLTQFKNLLVGDLANLFDSVIQISSLPEWYWVLPEHQQFFLEHVLKKADKIEEVVSFLPSRLRDLPAPANYAAHSLSAWSKKGDEYALLYERHRSSHIATRNGLKWPYSVQKRHVDSNLAVVMKGSEGRLAILQTLISPIHAADYMPFLLTDYLPPDLELYKLARGAVERRKNTPSILQNNHPYNLAKRIYYTQAHDKDSLALLDTAKEYVSSTPGLQILLDQYQSVLRSARGSATIFDDTGRELFLSSLEHLIILTIGGHSYGSCVSGKDRKAIELLHTDAMILYKELYGSWPVFDEFPNKENRSRFVSLVAMLYMSRHQHEHAGQNAPGSEGIKTPERYLPDDFAKEIKKCLGNEQALGNDNRLATNNEVKNIFIEGSKGLKRYLLPKDKLLCGLVARQLGKHNCTELYDALTLLINEKNIFVSKESSSRWVVSFFALESDHIPNGIKQIFELMVSPLSGKDNVIRIEKILQVVSDRPRIDTSRTKATNSVYGCLRTFLTYDKRETDFSNLVAATVEEWTKLFDESKKAHVLAKSL